MSMSLRRKMALRAQAAAERGVERRLAGLSRAGQVARSTVPVGEVDLPVVETLETAVDAAAVLPGVVEAVDQAGSDAYEAAIRVDEAQAAADGAAADALAAAQAAADANAAASAAGVAAAGAQSAADAASTAAAQAAQDATDKSAAAEAAAKAYAEAQAAAAEAAAVAEASGDATAKAAAAQAAAEAAAALDAKAKADAAEAAAKADAAAAQSTADQAVSDAAAAQSAADAAQGAADSVRFLAEGLYQAIPSVTAPTESPTGALKQGDLWFQIGATGTNVEGKLVGIQVWDGMQWVPREMLADSLVVVGPDGVVRVANGKVTAESMAASFYYGREFHGGLFSGGLFRVSQGETEVWSVPPVTTSEGLDTWWGDSPRLGTTWSTPDAAIKMTSNGSTRAMFTTTDELPAYPFGAVVEVTFRVKATQLASGGGTPRVSANVYWDGMTPGVPTVPVLDEWVDVSTQLPVPPGVAVGRITIDAIQPGGTSTYLIDGLSAKVTRFDGESLVVGRDAKGAPIIQFGRSVATTTISPSNALIGGRFTNPGNTFALKSQLEAWAPIDGTHAWVTSEGREYVRAGGVWKVAFEDTPWANAALGPNVTGTARWRRYMGVIYVEFNVTSSAAIAGDGLFNNVFTLPMAAWPGTGSPVDVSGQGTRPAMGNIGSLNGVLAIRNLHTGSVSTFYGSGQWLASDI